MSQSRAVQKTNKGAINKNTKPQTSTDTNTKPKAIADTNTEYYYQRLGLRLILALHYGRVAQSRAVQKTNKGAINK